MGSNRRTMRILLVGVALTLTLPAVSGDRSVERAEIHYAPEENLELERFPHGRNWRGIPELAEIGFTVDAGLEAGWDGETVFRRSTRACGPVR